MMQSPDHTPARRCSFGWRHVALALVAVAAGSALAMGLARLEHAAPSPKPPFRSIYGIKAFLSTLSRSNGDRLATELCSSVRPLWEKRMICNPRSASLRNVVIEDNTIRGKRYLVVDLSLEDEIVLPWSELVGSLGKMDEQPELVAGHLPDGRAMFASASYKFSYPDPHARITVWVDSRTTRDEKLARVYGINVNVDFY